MKERVQSALLLLGCLVIFAASAAPARAGSLYFTTSDGLNFLDTGSAANMPSLIVPEGTDGLVSASGVFARNSNNIVVGSLGTNRILEFEANGSPAGEFAPAFSFTSPRELTKDKSDLLWVNQGRSLDLFDSHILETHFRHPIDDSDLSSSQTMAAVEPRNEFSFNTIYVGMNIVERSFLSWVVAEYSRDGVFNRILISDFGQVQDVVYGPQGSLYVAGSDSAGDFLNVYSAHTGEQHFGRTAVNRIFELDFGSDGSLYALGESEITKYNVGLGGPPIFSRSWELKSAASAQHGLDFAPNARINGKIYVEFEQIASAPPYLISALIGHDSFLSDGTTTGILLPTDHPPLALLPSFLRSLAAVHLYTDAGIGGPYSFAFQLDPALVPSDLNGMRLLHLDDDGGYMDITTMLDAQNLRILGTSDTLGTFVLAQVVQAVPEPGTGLFVALGLTTLLGRRSRPLRRTTTNAQGGINATV